MIRHMKVCGLVRILTAVFVMAALLVGLVMPASTASAADVKVLLFHGNDPSGAGSLETNLIATGLLTADDIDIMGMTSTLPPLATLSNYDCIIVFTDGSPSNPVANGDRLKEYVQAGGRVVLSTYALSLPTDPWEMQGGIMDDGFNPLDLTNTRQEAFPRSLDFGTAQTSHCLLNGVSDFDYGGNYNYCDVTLDPGATLIGSDNYGIPLIAINASGNVIGINLYPGDAFNKSAGVFRTYANACICDMTCDRHDQLDNYTGWGLWNDRLIGQSFTAHWDYSLTSVELYLLGEDRPQGPPEAVTVYIYSTSPDGLPDTVLDSVYYPLGEEFPAGWQRFTFDQSGVSLSACTQYAIVLYPEGPEDFTLHWYGTMENQYTEGSAMGEGYGGWEDYSPHDYFFRIYGTCEGDPAICNQPLIPPTSVGGEVLPINKASLLIPWLTLAAILALGGIIFVMRRQRAS